MSKEERRKREGKKENFDKEINHRMIEDRSKGGCTNLS